MLESNAPFHKYEMEKMCRSNSWGKIHFTALGPGRRCGCLQLLPVHCINRPGMVCPSSLQSSDKCSDHYAYYSVRFPKES